MPAGTYVRTLEIRENARIKNLGRVFSKDTLNKMRKAKIGNVSNMKGKKWEEESRKKISGENNYGWKGDKVKYGSLHKWISKNFGKADLCEWCSSAPAEWSNKDHNYTRERKDWQKLCKQCHGIYDSEMRSKNNK